MKRLVYLAFLVSIFACKRGPIVLNTHFDPTNVPPEVDYSKPENWAALPTKADLADSLPFALNLTDGQANAKADVFFIHPTIFTYKPTGKYIWNADVNDALLNTRTDQTSILNQATAFNGSCRIFAPRYRQAHYFSFVTTEKSDSKQALDLAYSDVKQAFEYYLLHENNGRPIVIASHSQGTVHAKRLLIDFFDGKELQSKLLMAYIIGIALPPDSFQKIKPSEAPNQIGCFATWNTFSKGYYPKWSENGTKQPVCTNPINWTSSEVYEPFQKNLGGIGRKFKYYPQITDAQINKGLLWINRPNISGAFFVREKVWHVADINFFWMNIRQNVAERIEQYFIINQTNN